ncbi:MAG: phosphopyruvate hydratase [Candidatus Kerfeldbacteria bacterium]|nr:phosphopyruvate hydratase [Candidatus Kerfeldbacteria bacterium]
MAHPTIDHVMAHEVLDSRGEPTVRATVVLTDGQRGAASVPAGVSTGAHEALELRDLAERFAGKGVRKAVARVNGTIGQALIGMRVDDQPAIDHKLIELDGTPDRSNLGANSILSVSLAAARTASIFSRLPLYQYLQKSFGLPRPDKFPRPMCNVLNGAKHADNNISFQEYQVLAGGKTYAAQIERTARIIDELREILRHHGDRILVGDEGGFAPMLESNEQGLEFLSQAVARSDLRLGDDVNFGLDVAASEFYSIERKIYLLQPEVRAMTAAELISLYQELVAKYPIKTLEDGLAEDDWDSWKLLTERLGKKITIIGDDLFATQRDRLNQGIKSRAANAILIKPNQVGTLTETMETIATARRNGYQCVVSHRSGETCDDFIADLAVAIGSEYLKAGSLMRSERLAKYNRLLEIAAEVGA